MLLQKQKVKTEFGTIEPREVVHCDQCGKKSLAEGAKAWLEVRRLDYDIAPIHFCGFRCLVLGIVRLDALGVEAIDKDNWDAILKHASSAGDEEHGI